MNNGVTIITKKLSKVSNNFTLSDYQIVNVCQTSNVLFEHKGEINDTVAIPLRLIHTEDESINELITTATNSQTAIKPEQFASRRIFARGMEDFFATFPEETRLYYERRDGQYDRSSAPKRRIINISTAIRSYAAIFQELPHAVTKSYKAIRDQIGESIFTDGHKYMAYYYAAWSWHVLEELYYRKVIDKAYISARFHMLFAVHLMIDSGPKPKGNSKDIDQRSEASAKILWDQGKAEDLFKKAADLIYEITEGELDRDTVRTEAVTKAIIERLRPTPSASGHAATAG